MLTAKVLDLLKKAAQTDAGTDETKDISLMEIDRTKTVPQRIEKFVSEVRNPYLFKVGNVKVRVGFSGAASISERMAGFLHTEYCEYRQTPMK